MLQITPACVKLAEKLELAANLLETDGWVRGQFQRGESRCLVGALHAANGTKTSYGHTPMGAIRALGFRSKHAAMQWNDNSDRNRGEVIARLRKAAADQRELSETPRG